MARPDAKSDSRPWIPCPEGCENPWCTEHELHAFECPCPALGDDTELEDDLAPPGFHVEREVQ